MNQNKKKKQKGFTLIETLVSIFILLLAITGPLTVAQNGLKASFLARDQIVAFYLAQDVIETIKHLRDNYALGLQQNMGHWLAGLGNCKPVNVGIPVVCTLDTSGNNVVTNSCQPGKCPQLGYDESIGKFGYSAGSPSKYTRTIYVTEIESNREAQIVVEIEWDSNFFAKRHVVVQENIFNWIPALLNFDDF